MNFNLTQAIPFLDLIVFFFACFLCARNHQYNLAEIPISTLIQYIMVANSIPVALGFIFSNISPEIRTLAMERGGIYMPVIGAVLILLAIKYFH